MALFYPYPNLGFAEDAPFMLKLREKTGRVGLMEDVEGLCLHIVHSTSSTPDPAISHHLSEEKLNGLAVSDCTAYEDFMDHYWENFSWITNLFTSLFHFWWSCWSDLRTCRSDQLVSPLSDFTNFTISHQFHHVQNIEDCSLKVGKDTTAFEPGSWEWKVSCHVWTPKAVVGWSVRRDTLKDRSFVVKKNNKKDVVNRNQASGTMRPTSVASILIEFDNEKLTRMVRWDFSVLFSFGILQAHLERWENRWPAALLTIKPKQRSTTKPKIRLVESDMHLGNRKRRYNCRPRKSDA